MGLLKKIASIGSEFMLISTLVLLFLLVLIALYVPLGSLSFIVEFLTIFGLILLLICIFWIGVLALIHKLQFKLGFRNLIRHKADTIIAILGFMIGTSIICSSLAIGDTMETMVENLSYDSYYLVDEYMEITGGNGEPVDIDGDMANNISSIIWELENEGLVDGVSWEYTQQFSVINMGTMLFEPVIQCRALNPETYSSFGSLTSDGNDLDYELEPYEAYMSKDLSEDLEAETGSVVLISNGIESVNFTVKAIVDDQGRASSSNGAALYMNFQDLWSISNVTPVGQGPVGDGRDWSGGVYNILLVSNEGGKIEGADHCEDVVSKAEKNLKVLPHPLGPNGEWKFNGNKEEVVETSVNSMEIFTKLFLVLGTFTIIVGITLIINIFVMLSEERKEEMGISRAIGMRRKDLRMTYLFEGTLYSIVSSFVGVILGMGSGYAIIWGMQSIFESFGAGGLDLLGNYTVTPLSLVLSFIAGFTITITTTLVITRRVAKLNIVSAIRNTPIPLKRPRLVTLTQKLCGVYDVKSCSGDDSTLSKILEYFFNKMTILGFVLIFLGIPITLLGVVLEHFGPTSLGISMILIGLALVIKHFTNERITYTIAGVLVLIFWMIPLPVFEDYAGGMEMFILSGIFMVTSAVMILIWNSDILLWLIDKVVTLIGLSPAVIKMAISYPMKKKFRTGVTIFMFALIIFTITGMSMIVHIMNVNIQGWEKTIGGGYNVIGVSTFGIEDLEATVLEEESNNIMGIEVYSQIDWDNTVSISVGVLTINQTLTMQGMHFNNEIMYQCAGVDSDFIEKNSYGFSEVDWDLVYPGGSSEHHDRDVWRAIEENPDLVALDGMMGGESAFGPAGGAGAMKAGDTLKLINVNGTEMEKTIVGFTEQMGISAVFMSEETAEDEFSVTEKQVHLFAFNDGVKDQDAANDLKRVLLRYGMYTVIISDIIEEMLEAQNAFFNLFNAFLSLGLIIGIIGLGIITLRAVYERRHEIGMMRAIGFKKRAVVTAFIGESSFIAGSGLILGTVLGIILGWMLYRDGFADTMDEFGIPWMKLLGIAGLAFVIAILSTVPPALKAASVTPANALRYD